jgi:hypothetical protein
MRFLGLTTLQAALLALITTSTIVALYFLKHRRQRIVISSVLLWRRILENYLENSIFEKLRKVLSILIAVVTGLLVAMAIPRPEIDLLTGKARRSVIVLDTSATMQARTSDGRTRWQRAVELAHELVSQGSISTQFRIADTAGQFDSPFTTDRTELRKLIERMHPVISPTRFPDIDPTPQNDDTSIYLITDGVSSLREPAGATSLSVFESAPNTGITAFEIRSMPSAALAYEAYLEVSNFGKDTRAVDITVSGAGQQRITRNVTLESGKSYKEALDLSQFEGGGIRAAIHSDDDSFSPDDVAYAYLPVKRRTKTLLVTRGNKLLETALKLDRLVDLSLTDPNGYASNNPPISEFDAFVFDRFAPQQAPPRPALVIGAQPVPWLRESTGNVTRPNFDSWMEDHPIMRQVSLHDVTIDTAARIDASNLSILAAAAGNTPLIVASERPRWIMLTFNLEASDFPYHSGFPLFIDNALAWFDRERLALRRAPGVIDVPISGAQVRTIDGRPIPSRDHLDGISFEAPEPGLYVATQGNSQQYVAVNFANRQYSDINNSRIRENKQAPVQAAALGHELWFYMLFGALLLIGAEWYTYHRRITL